MKPEVIYYNLTQGLACIDPINIHFLHGARFCRLQSSLIEAKKWDRFFEHFPDDILFHLALGQKVIIYEASTGKGKLSTFARLIRYIIWRAWTRKELPTGRLGDYPRQVWNQLPKPVKQKIAYYGQLDPQKIDLVIRVHKIKVEKELWLFIEEVDKQ